MFRTPHARIRCAIAVGLLAVCGIAGCASDKGTSRTSPTSSPVAEQPEPNPPGKPRFGGPGFSLWSHHLIHTVTMNGPWDSPVPWGDGVHYRLAKNGSPPDAEVAVIAPRTDGESGTATRIYRGFVDGEPTVTIDSTGVMICGMKETAVVDATPIPVTFDTKRSQDEVTDAQVDEMRALMRQLVCEEERQEAEVAVAWVGHPGGTLMAIAELPSQRDGTYSIGRRIEMRAGNWMGSSASEERGDRVVAKRVYTVQRLFELGDVRVETLLGDGVSYDEAKQLLTAMRDKRVSYASDVAIKTLPALEQVSRIERRDDRIRVTTTVPNGGRGWRYECTITETGVIVHQIRGWIL